MNLSKKSKFTIIITFLLLLGAISVYAYSRPLKIIYYTWRYESRSFSLDGQEIIDKLIALKVIPCELSETSETRSVLGGYYLHEFGESKDTLKKYFAPRIFTDNENDSWVSGLHYFIFDHEGHLIEVNNLETTINSQEEWNKFRKR